MSPLRNLEQAFEPLLAAPLALDRVGQGGGGDGDLHSPLGVTADADLLRLKLMNLTHAAVNQVLYGTLGPLGERRG